MVGLQQAVRIVRPLSVPSTFPALGLHLIFTVHHRHRHPKSHSCQIQPTVESKNETARALLAKNFPSTSKAKAAPARRPAKIPTDPVKLAQFRKLELMKMRHNAVPADPKDKLAVLPQDDRRHIKVACDDNTEKVFWVRKVSLSSFHRRCALLILSSPWEQDEFWISSLLSSRCPPMLRYDNFFLHC
jgi:hypothetical protein